jgi:predicted GIY-YIG superfamily endonuclease
MENLSYVYRMGSASRRALYTGVSASLYKRVWEHKNNLGGFLQANINVIGWSILSSSQT